MKAIALLSGGLDSTLATKLMVDQGIEVFALKFTSPFCLCNQKGKCYASQVASELGIPIKVVNKTGPEYFKLLQNPKYGYGSEMNPCLDCRIFMFKKAKQIAKQVGAKFIFTGEVLNERPMSQHRKALWLIEKEAGLENKVLRPLSAKLLPETEAEKRGWVKREKLLAMHGRTRKPQIALAKRFNLNNYPCPSGGCLLTYHEFACKIRDLFKYKRKIDLRDIELLKVGRHFRFGANKLVVGRNQEENKKLLGLKSKTEYFLEATGCGSPTTILQGPKTRSAISVAAKLTAHYSDSSSDAALIRYGKERLNKQIKVGQIAEDELNKLRLSDY